MPNQSQQAKEPAVYGKIRTRDGTLAVLGKGARWTSEDKDLERWLNQVHNLDSLINSTAAIPFFVTLLARAAQGTGGKVVYQMPIAPSQEGEIH